MKVLLLGGGAREHALGWKLADDGARVASAPGNPGLAELGTTLAGLPITDPSAVTEAADGYDLVVVGPEAPLAAGVVDALAGAGRPALGPTRAAARLEWSKAWAKEVMERAGVATAAGRAFTGPAGLAGYLAERAGPYVVKADGLAAGKGVLVTDDVGEAERWAQACFAGEFGPAGETVVVEDYLEGPELSVFALCGGTAVVPLAPARDYKRLRDGDAGPNTGGMGCYSPVPDLPDRLVDEAMATVIAPVLAELADRGIEYRGFLYAGLVLGAAGLQVLEFNCRLGDPETQVVLPRLEDNLADLAMAAASGALAPDPLRWSPEAAVDVVLAAPGYPGRPVTGAPIEGLPAAGAQEGVHVFHAGTAVRDGRTVTAGGRVVNLVGMGPDLATARARAYRAAAVVEFPGKQIRTDIAAPGAAPGGGS